MRLRYYLAGLLSGLLLLSVGLGKAHRLSGQPVTLAGKLALAKAQVRHDQREISSTRQLQWTLLRPIPSRVLFHRWWFRRDLAYVKQLERQIIPSWLVQAFLCIHRGEGSWTSNTGNGYFGGLQMDYSFMATYGPELLARKGTADHWTPWEQIQVAIRAYRTRGFYPWPNTARACGLL